jgi:hydroxyacylglutathione hydrolase
MRIVPVPCLKDNYAYLVICEATGEAVAVDPSDAGPVLEAAEREGVKLRAVWNTHHHWDHVGGNDELSVQVPGIEVVAHSSDQGRVPNQTRGVDEGDEIAVGEEVVARVIHNPGHTSGAISYVIDEPAAVFTGDTLFGAGCGRLFEGTPAEMRASLAKLAELPAQTRVYCGHEYTEKNLRFAAAAEPGNEAVAERRQKVEALLADGRPTVPFTIGEELETNPFLRTGVDRIAAVVAEHEPPDETGEDGIFAALRRWKDRF